MIQRSVRKKLDNLECVASGARHDYTIIAELFPYLRHILEDSYRKRVNSDGVVSKILISIEFTNTNGHHSRFCC